MGYSQIEVKLLSFWGSDRSVAEGAWASTYDQEVQQQKSNEDVQSLVKRLVYNDHSTPKERVWLEFYMKVPIFVERQADKYRMTIQEQDFQIDYLHAPMGREGITQNELSGRYRTMPDNPYLMPEDVAVVMAKAAGFHEGALVDDAYLDSAAGTFKAFWDERVQAQHNSYSHFLSKLKEAEKAGAITNAEYKRAREVLRGELGTTYMTEMRMCLNMHAFEHIINQRLAPDSQLECRIMAALMLKEVMESGACPAMIEQMYFKNNWQDSYAKILAVLSV